MILNTITTEQYSKIANISLKLINISELCKSDDIYWINDVSSKDQYELMVQDMGCNITINKSKDIRIIINNRSKLSLEVVLGTNIFRKYALPSKEEEITKIKILSLRYLFLERSYEIRKDIEVSVDKFIQIYNTMSNAIIDGIFADINETRYKYNLPYMTMEELFCDTNRSI